LFELTIEDRCNKINELMECISLYDRQFFSFGKKLAKFSIEKGDIYYTPEYMVDKFKVILRSEHPMWKSSHGSCLRQQLINFTHYIKFGTLISLFDTYWGYSKQNLQKIHNKAKKLGLIKRAYI